MWQCPCTGCITARPSPGKSSLLSKILCNMITSFFLMSSTGAAFHMVLYHLPVGKSLCILALRVGAIQIHHFIFSPTLKQIMKHSVFDKVKAEFYQQSQAPKLCSPLLKLRLSTFADYLWTGKEKCHFTITEKHRGKKTSHVSHPASHTGVTALLLTFTYSDCHQSSYSYPQATSTEKKGRKRTNTVSQEDSCFPPKNECPVSLWLTVTGFFFKLMVWPKLS